MLVADDSAFAEARLLHPVREGYFTVAQRHAPDHRGKVWSERSYAMSSLEQVMGAVRNVPDLYVSQASFVTRRRGNATAKSVNAAFVDLDCYKLGLVPDEATVRALMLCADAVGLPAPSYVMASGRGLYAKWIFDQPLSGALVPHWKRLQDVLGHVFLAFGADANSRDLARVLRASSTLNSKSGETVRVIHQTGKVYRFLDLAAITAKINIQSTPEVTQAKIRQIRAKQDSLVEIPADLGALNEFAASREPVMLKQFSRESLNWTRFIDLRDLMLHRQGPAVGSRDVFLFWMTATLASSGVIDGGNFWPEVQNLLRAFPVSHDFDPLHDGSLETLRQRVEAHSRGEKIYFRGMPSSPIYTPTNDYLINVLQITDAEQQMLRTIISGSEKQRRSDLKVPGRSERRQTRSESRAVAVHLQTRGLSITAIAGELGVNKSTVSRWLAIPEKTSQVEVSSHQKTWDAQHISEWLTKRKASQQDRARSLEMEHVQKVHLEAAAASQSQLKTSVHLMAIFEKMQARDLEPRLEEQDVHRQSHPLEPPEESSPTDVPADSYGELHGDDFDEVSSRKEFERPRF